MTDPHSDLLRPGAHRAAGLLDDHALVRAMLDVETAWIESLAAAGAAEMTHVQAVRDAIRELPTTLDPVQVEAAGNPVLELVRTLRRRVPDSDAAALVHYGLTSQDVLDTALMLLGRDAAGRIIEDLRVTARGLGRLAGEHRASVMVGRTLTQYAVPVTFGLKAAQWLWGVLDAAAALSQVAETLPVQCGGAAGTLSKAALVVADPDATARALADRLGLRWPGAPWHTRRTPVTRLGDSLTEVCDAIGKIATDILLLGRPEIAEVRELSGTGRGGSSTMPHKQNPVLAVLVRSASLQAPGLASTLHACAAAAVDERPDGAWHAEWPTLRALLEITGTSASQAAELVRTLQVDSGVMARRVEDASGDLLAERGGDGPGAASSYLGAAGQFLDRALARLDEEIGHE